MKKVAFRIRELYRELKRRIHSSYRYIHATNLPLRIVVKKLAEVDIILMGAAIAYGALLTLIPLLIIFASVIGIVLHQSELGIQQLSTIIDAIFPPQPYAVSIKEAIIQLVSDMIAYRTSLGIIGFIALFITATFVFDIVRTALHRIYGIKRKKGLVVSFLHDIWFVLLALVLLFTTNLAVWTLTFLRGMLAKMPEMKPMMIPEFDQILPGSVVILMTAVLFYIVYAHITDERPPRVAALASTATMTVLWLASGKVFSIYLQSYSVIGSIYGPYAFLLVLLLWVYYSSVIFVLGGIVGQVYWETLKTRQDLPERDEEESGGTRGKNASSNPNNC
jgi:membrane protein